MEGDRAGCFREMLGPQSRIPEITKNIAYKRKSLHPSWMKAFILLLVFSCLFSLTEDF